MIFTETREGGVTRNRVNYWSGDLLEAFKDYPNIPLVVNHVPFDRVNGTEASLVGLFNNIARYEHHNPYIQIRFREENPDAPDEGYVVEVQRFDPDNFFE